jgi:hypothetical protein
MVVIKRGVYSPARRARAPPISSAEPGPLTWQPRSELQRRRRGPTAVGACRGAQPEPGARVEPDSSVCVATSISLCPSLSGSVALSRLPESPLLKP